MTFPQPPSSSVLRRRLVVAAITAGVIAGALPPALAQTARPRIAVLGERSANDPWLDAFGEQLRELGYVDGGTATLTYRYAESRVDRLPALVGELLAGKPDVLVVGGAAATRAALAATKSVPIVFTQVGDPVGFGLVASLARPGGNATGLSNLITELTAKQIELMKQAVPKVRRLGILHNPRNSEAARAVARQAARALEIELAFAEVAQPADLAPAFERLAAGKVDAILALSDPVFGTELAQYAKLAAQRRLPAMYSHREFPQAGGLIAYGPNFAENWRRAANYVDRILKGAKPGDLPVEQPAKLELVVNLRAARLLGVDVAPSVLQRADDVIR
jgi:putative ABC transport system substrate-binding protein